MTRLNAQSVAGILATTLAVLLAVGLAVSTATAVLGQGHVTWTKSSSLETARQALSNTDAARVPFESEGGSRQVLFSVGARPQRVRFLLAAHGQTFDQMQTILGPGGSASIRKLIDDPIQCMPNVPQGKYIRQAKPPAAPGVGLDSFAEGDNFYAGEVINPGLVMCSANLLNLVKAAGDKRESLFKRHAINEINLFVRAVPEPTGDDPVRVEVGPAAVDRAGSALNVLVEYLPLELKCSLPTLQNLEHRLSELESSLQ